MSEPVRICEDRRPMRLGDVHLHYRGYHQLTHDGGFAAIKRAADDFRRKIDGWFVEHGSHI